MCGEKQFRPNSDSAGATEAKSDQNEYLNLLNSLSALQIGGDDARMQTDAHTYANCLAALSKLSESWQQIQFLRYNYDVKSK